MSDVMLQAAVKLATEQAASPASSPQIADAGSMDASRFRDAMAGGTPDQGLGVELQEPPVADLQKSDLSAQLPTETGNSPGDSILDGLGRMRSEQNVNVQQINELVGGGKDGGPMTVQETMELQFRLMQLSLQQDLTAKVADKSSQGVQNLMKNQ